MLDAVEEDLDLVARHDCNDRRSVQVLASLDPASRTAYKTFSTEGLKKNRNFLATVRPSTWTVSSPRFPSTTSTSTPGSFRKASATRAACSRVPPQTGHSRMVTFFIADLLSILIRLRPLRTISLFRVSGLPTLAVLFITAMPLGAVKCPATVLRTPAQPAPRRTLTPTPRRLQFALGPSAIPS